MATAVSPGEQCPECGGQLQQTGELVCTECHIVVDDAVIDPGPEWRHFTDDDVDRRRTGPPKTRKLHDGGLSTIIGTVNDRAQLSGQKRRRMERQRTHHTRAQTRSKAERNQRYALSQVQRIASALDCSDEVTERACQLFSDAQEAELTIGRSIDALVPACILVAARQTTTVRTVEDIADAAHCSAEKIRRSRLTLQRELDVRVPVFLPTDLLPSIFESLSGRVPKSVRIDSYRLAEAAETSTDIRGSPSSLAAAAVYVAVGSRGRWSQQEIAKAADISSASIRNHYEALEALDSPATFSAD